MPFSAPRPQGLPTSPSSSSKCPHTPPALSAGRSLICIGIAAPAHNTCGRERLATDFGNGKSAKLPNALPPPPLQTPSYFQEQDRRRAGSRVSPPTRPLVGTRSPVSHAASSMCLFCTPAKARDCTQQKRGCCIAARRRLLRYTDLGGSMSRLGRHRLMLPCRPTSAWSCCAAALQVQPGRTQHCTDNIKLAGVIPRQVSSARLLT